ncbi:hypothetical protein GCM10028857_03580 [Salinarchaeum chitinilyticum]
MKLLGALTKDGEPFVTEVADSFTNEITVRFLRALQTEFGDHLHIILDNATYFASNRVAEFVEETAIELTLLPPGSPDMNPIEECWRQFKRRFGNRYFDSIEEPRPAIRPALAAVHPPIIYDYLCQSVSWTGFIQVEKCELAVR